MSKSYLVNHLGQESKQVELLPKYNTTKCCQGILIFLHVMNGQL